MTVNGAGHAAAFGKAATFIEREDGKDQSALILRDVALSKPGTYRCAPATARAAREVTWTVYDTGPRRPRT